VRPLTAHDYSELPEPEEIKIKEVKHLRPTAKNVETVIKPSVMKAVHEII
jgi:hypothetical protein